MRRLLLSLAAASLLAATSAGAALAGGPPVPEAFYVDGALYRTIATPTDLSGTGAPDSSYDTIYALGNGLTNVAEAAPGDRDYNGGRWKVRGLMVSDYAGALANDNVDMNQNDVLDSSEEVDAAIMHGYVTDVGVVHSFVCPVIKLPRGR